MHRLLAIEAALAKRNFSRELAPRIERLLDGVEDRHRLRCCSSGCYVCVRELLAVLDEVELTAVAGSTLGTGLPIPTEKCPAGAVAPPRASGLRQEDPR